MASLCMTATMALAMMVAQAAAQTQTYNGFTTQEDTSAIVQLGVDQKTLETIINANKDDPVLAEQDFQTGLAFYNGTNVTSSLTFHQLATDEEFFRSNGETGPFFASFQKFVDYFGNNDQYMDVTCVAGFNGGDADFSAGGGPNFEYSLYDAFGRADVIEKATNYLIVVMMIQGSLEKAVESCKSNFNVEAQDYLDEAVAYYVGSETLNGPFFFNLAVSRCGNFGVCVSEGVAPVNELAFSEFNALRASLASESGTDCANSDASIQNIISHMAIPLIQGTLRYAVFLGLDGISDDKTKGEGAIFAQSVLPYVDACSSASAATIFDNMKPVAGTPNVDFDAVLAAFEATYDCLGITSADIGCYDGRAETCPSPAAPTPDAAPAPTQAAPTPEAPSPSTEETTSSSSSLGVVKSLVAAVATVGSLVAAVSM